MGIMVPADGNFTTAIAKGNHKAGEIQGQTRQHSRLINLLGVKQICIGVNKMDCDTAGYKQERYDEISNEMKSMLIKVGWKKDFIEKNTPVLPISGWMGDNLLKKSSSCQRTRLRIRALGKFSLWRWPSAASSPSSL